MSGIYFDKNGATMDEWFEKDEFKPIVDIINANKDKLSEETVETINKIYKHTAKQNDRTIHIVVAEPVEYDWD